MVNSKEGEFVGDRKIEGSDREIQDIDEVFEGSSVGVSSKEIDTSDVGSTGPSRMVQGNTRSSVSDGSLTERLRDILIDETDGDLLLQQTDRDNNIFQWLQALDLQVIGACRADERLKPLLKLNVSCGVAEDRLLAHLSQHFEAPEVGMLARCLCMPLVSIRVGRVIKQGTFLCPTAARLATLGGNAENSAVVIEEIPADNSGRSFLLKTPSGQVSYFWCSEKSKVLGSELLAKMKDLLRRKPSLAKLTGISESRLDCFAVHLRAYLLGSTVNSPTQANPFVSATSPLDTAFDPSELNLNTQVSFSLSNPSHTQHNRSQALEDHLCYQSSLGPTSDIFEGGLPESISSIQKASREKFMQLGNTDCSVFHVDNLCDAATSMIEVTGSTQPESDKLPEVSEAHPLPLSFLESLGKPIAPLSSNQLSLGLPLPESPVAGSLLFSPYYCWCPPPTSTLQYAVTPPHQPISWVESLSLPPLSSLLSAARSSSSLTQLKPPLNLADVPSLDFPAFLPDPVVRVPLPITSFITGPSSQQIPTFTPLMCDPIVHVPIIDVCSSGEGGYLVSAGHAITTTIPPLHSNIVNPLIPETESVLEKGARETLRMLLSSTQANPQLMEVLPAALNTTEERRNNIIVAGSRGLYSGTRDVNAIANTIAAMGMVSLPHTAARCDVSDLDLENHSEGVRSSKGSCSSDDATFREESC